MTYPSNSDSVAQDMLASLVRRIEGVDDQIKALNDDKSELYKEAKGSGFDVKVLRKVIADRRKDAAERAEFEAIYDLYWNAVNGLAHAHVEIIEEIRPGRAQDAQQPPKLPVAGSTPAPVATDSAAIAPKPVAADTPEVAGSASGGIQSTAARKDVLTNRVAASARQSRSGASAGSPEAGTQAPPVDTEIPQGTMSPEAQTVPATETEPVVTSPAWSEAVAIQASIPGYQRSTTGLLRLSGCQKPDCCGSTSPRSALCFTCARAHQSPHSSSTAPGHADA